MMTFFSIDDCLIDDASINVNGSLGQDQQKNSFIVKSREKMEERSAIDNVSGAETSCGAAGDDEDAAAVPSSDNATGVTEAGSGSAAGEGMEAAGGPISNSSVGATEAESGAAGGGREDTAGQPSEQPTTQVPTYAANYSQAAHLHHMHMEGMAAAAAAAARTKTNHFQDPYGSMFHPMFNQWAMLHPQFQQMSPQQQQILLFQQYIMSSSMMMQQMGQQQIFQQSQNQGATAAGSASQDQSTNVEAQNSQAQQMMMMAHQSIIQQQLLQQSIQQQQFFQQSHPQAAAAAAATTSQSHLSQPAPTSHGLGQAPNTSFLQAPPQFDITHPLYYWNLQNPQGIQAIYQADESNYNNSYNNHYDSDDDDENPDRSSQKLLRFVEDHHWVAALQRITTHPRETQQVGIQGRTPLHVACDHDAPPALVQAILSAWPEGAERVGTSHMNPCTPHASVDVVRVLLSGCPDPLMITGAKDVDGDTPLHAACRCAAPMDVLVTLLQANPITVTWKDYEGLNPLMRLWVRYFVLVGEQIISNIKQPSDLNSDLVEAWQKSLLLLQVMSAMQQRVNSSTTVDNVQNSEQQQQQQQQVAPFRTVHAASSVDCPRCVVRIAMVLFPHELLNRDEKNRLPIHIAAAAPVYAVHDLRGEGFTIDDALLDDEDPESRAARSKKKESKYKEPSVIDILLGGAPAAASERDNNGQLPLHVAIMRGKTLDEGVNALVEAHPDALTTPDYQTNLYPFMLAASVGRGRGHCSTIYALLRAAPDLVHMALSKESQEDVESENEKQGEKPRANKTES